jgi:hypothetical protein
MGYYSEGYCRGSSMENLWFGQFIPAALTAKRRKKARPSFGRKSKKFCTPCTITTHQSSPFQARSGNNTFIYLFALPRRNLAKNGNWNFASLATDTDLLPVLLVAYHRPR